MNLKHHVRSFLSINYFPFFGAVQKKNAERLNFVIDLHGPVRAAGDEDLGVEVVPLDGVHRHAVGVVGLQDLAGVGLGALQEEEEGDDCNTSTWQFDSKSC